MGTSAAFTDYLVQHPQSEKADSAARLLNLAVCAAALDPYFVLRPFSSTGTVKLAMIDLGFGKGFQSKVYMVEGDSLERIFLLGSCTRVDGRPAEHGSFPIRGEETYSVNGHVLVGLKADVDTAKVRSEEIRSATRIIALRDAGEQLPDSLMAVYEAQRVVASYHQRTAWARYSDGTKVRRELLVVNDLDLEGGGHANSRLDSANAGRGN